MEAGEQAQVARRQEIHRTIALGGGLALQARLSNYGDGAFLIVTRPFMVSGTIVVSWRYRVRTEPLFQTRYAVNAGIRGAFDAHKIVLTSQREVRLLQ